MTSQWPDNTWDDSNVEDVFQLAQNFELHCAQVYDHAASNPKDAASADYVMQLALQAYRTVHSLHMQKVASSYCNIDVAAAALESKVAEYRKSQQDSPCQQPTLDECVKHDSSALDQQIIPAPGNTLEDLMGSDLEDDESDSDWEESDEESDDDYYEYYEGSEADSDLEDVMQEDGEEDLEENAVEEVQSITTDRPALNLQTRNSEDITTKTASLPSSSILRDAKMNDSILAALQNLAIGEPNQTPPAPAPAPVPAPASAEPQMEPPNTASTVPPSETHSETTAVQTQSNREPSRQSSTTVGGIDTVQSAMETGRGYEKSSIQVNPDRIPRRLKTVCSKYIRRAMVPIRGKAH